MIREITPEINRQEAKHSRHNRRKALMKTIEMVDKGYVRLLGVPYEFDHAFRALAPECFTRALTHYQGLRRPTEVHYQDWYKSPMAGVTPGQILNLAYLQYHNDPEERYRVPYTLKLILQSDPDTILTELMMYELAGT